MPHHRPGIGETRSFQKNCIDRTGSKAFRPVLQLFQRIDDIGPERAAYASVLQTHDVLLGDEILAHCSDTIPLKPV